MSASVFKPIRPLSLELPRLRGALVSRGLQRVRRVLFEPVDHVETEKFLECEMAKQRLNECNKWEFDFHAGKPYACANNNNNNNGGGVGGVDDKDADGSRSAARFVWTPLAPAACARAPKKAACDAAACDNAHLYPSLPDKRATPTPMVGKRQSKITDFMQSRKRSAELAFAKKQQQPPLSPTAKRVAPGGS